MQQSPVEVERKWLVRELPELSAHEGLEVIQGYIAIAANGTEARLRHTDGKFSQTMQSEEGSCVVRSSVGRCRRGHGALHPLPIFSAQGLGRQSLVPPHRLRANFRKHFGCLGGCMCRPRMV